MYDDNTYQEQYRIDLNLPVSDTREPIQVISMVVNSSGQYIALSVGKNLINGIEEIAEIIIMMRDPETNEFFVIKNIDMEEIGMTDMCKQICFDEKMNESLLFVTKDIVYRFNFFTCKKYKVFDFIQDFDE